LQHQQPENDKQNVDVAPRAAAHGYFNSFNKLSRMGKSR